MGILYDFFVLYFYSSYREKRILWLHKNAH